MVMKKERKFTWCVRYYDITSRSVDYRIFASLTASEISKEVADFLDSNENYIVRVFKYYKYFCNFISI